MSFASALKPSDHTFVISEHDGGASTLPEPPTKKRLVLDDSDNEDSLMPTQSEVILVQDTQFPAIPRGYPVFVFPSDPALASIEHHAVLLLCRPQPPTKAELVHLYDRYPRTLLRRGPEGTTYLVSGANPRCSEAVLTHSRDSPYMTMLVNRFIHSFSPKHPYSSWVLRKGSTQKPHRDIRNGPFDSWIISLSPSKPSDGLWVADRVGTTCKRHQGRDLLGTVLSLDTPKTFNARKLLHAGHVQDPRDVQDRIVLVAFSTLNAASLQLETTTQLKDLGFPLPSRTAVHFAIHGSVFGEEPRLRQMTLTELLQLPLAEKDMHAVVEVLDSPPNRWN